MTIIMVYTLAASGALRMASESSSPQKQGSSSAGHSQAACLGAHSHSMRVWQSLIGPAVSPKVSSHTDSSLDTGMNVL